MGTIKNYGVASCLLLCAIAFCWMQFVSMSRFHAGHWYLADVGNIWACLGNTAHGRFMWSPMVETNHFACHFTPFLLLFVPTVWLSGYAIPLVTGYVLAIALTPLPIYFMARRRGLPNILSVLCGLLFLCNIFVISLVLADHFEAWFVLFMLWTMAAWHRKGVAFWTPLLLTLSVREDAAVWVGLFALWNAFAVGPWHEQKSRVLRVCLVCVCWLVLAISVMGFVISSQQQGVFNIVDYAARFKGACIGWDTVYIVALLIASTGGLCLFGGRSLILLLFPLPLLLVGFPFMRQLRYYYSYPFLPFLAYAMICGCQKVYEMIKERKYYRVALVALSIWIVIVAAIQCCLPSFTDGYRSWPLPLDPGDTEVRAAIVRHLPPDAKVAVSFGAFGVVPFRPGMNMFEKKYITDDSWVVLWLARHCGMEKSKFIDLARSVTDDVRVGKRHMAYESNTLLIISPCVKSGTGASGE